MTNTSHVPEAVHPAVESPPGAARIRVVAAALGAAALTIAALLVTAPWGDRLDSGADDIVNYDDLLAVRDAAWAGILVDAFAFAVVGLAVGLCTCYLARTRGRVAGLVGCLLSTAGGILFAMGSLAFATFTWFAAGLPEESGRSLVAYGNDHPGHLMGATLAGFALYTLGTLVLAAAAIRSRAVPISGVVVFVVLTLSQFLPLPGRALDVVQVLMMGLLVGYAAIVWRHRPLTGAPA